jgi:hypothetical protein
MFPTGLPPLKEHPKPPRLPLTPLQDLIGVGWVKGIHYGASAGFIICLAVVAVLFGIREGKLPPVPQKLPPRFWRGFHYTCAVVMGLGAAWIVVTSLAHSGPRWSTLLGEWICTWAWALSWLLKGAEWTHFSAGRSPADDPGRASRQFATTALCKSLSATEIFFQQLQRSGSPSHVDGP